MTDRSASGIHSRKGSTGLLGDRSTRQDVSEAELAELSRRSGLTRRQLAIWAGQQLYPSSPVYNVLFVWTLEGRVWPEVFQRAFQDVVDSSDALRTSLATVDGEPRSQVVPSLPRALELVDLTAGERPAAEVHSWVAERNSRPIDLEGKLFDSVLIKLGEGRFTWYLNQHHVITDSTSAFAILGLTLDRYATLVADDSSPPPVLAAFSDHVALEQQRCQDRAAEPARQHWRQVHEKSVAALELFGVSTFAPVAPSVRVTHDLGPRRSRRLTELASGVGRGAFGQLCTMSALTFAYLNKITGQRTLSQSIIVSNRGDHRFDRTPGLFINMIPVSVAVDDDATIVSVAGRVAVELSDSRPHQWYPITRPPRARLHDVAVNFAAMQTFRVQDVEVRRTEWIHNGCQERPLDVHFHDFDATGSLRLDFDFQSEVFDPPQRQRTVGQFLRLLDAVLDSPRRPLSRTPWLSPAERHQMVAEWNDTVRPLAAGCVHQLITEQVRRTPDATAVVWGEEAWSYSELEARVNLLAHQLRRLGVGPEARVGLSLEPSSAMLVGLLAVLKAGGAYVPLDPGLPLARRRFFIADAGIRLLLTSEQLRQDLAGEDVRLLAIDAAVTGPDPGPPATCVTPDNLAYVIYTSGSTGRPKGVGIAHRTVVQFLRAMEREPGITPRDALLAITTLSFDISVLELLLPLTSGARVVIAPPAASADPGRFARLIDDSGATILQATPASWQLLLQAGWRGRPDLKMLCGGEALPRELAARLLASGAELWNLYGPTETTIWSACCRLSPDIGEIMIGRPIVNTRLYVVDRFLEPVSQEMTGELVIGGAGLARGYLDRPRLCAECFVPDPFGPVWRGRPGSRLYRTGDRVRRRAAGELIFLGRLDHQVKVRGFRIEMGEIESALVADPRVRQAVVLVPSSGPDAGELVAYVVAEAAELHAASLRRGLAKTLPDYMVPASYVVLARLPLTANGKIDRAALGRLKSERPAGDRHYVAPRSSVEARLAAIWQDVLRVERVGVYDNFLALGGHSLIAVKAVSRIRDALGVELLLHEMFKRPTLEALAEAVEHRRTQGRVSSPDTPARFPRDGELPLSYSQERLWFLDQLEPGSSVFNLQIAMRWRGRLRPRDLAASLNQLRARHQALRTTFPAVDGAPRQCIMPPTPRRLPIVDLSGLPASERSAETERRQRQAAARPFDLAAGPLLRPLLFRLETGSADLDNHLLLLTLHHIVTDDWSNGVLRGELRALYQARRSGCRSPLPELPVQYADYALWQRQRLRGELLERELDYWRGKLGDEPPKLDLPTDRPRPRLLSPRGGSFRLVLARPQAEVLEALSRSAGASLFMTLLAAFKILLARITGQPDVSVGSPVAGRNRSEIEGLIGFFLNTLVLRTDLSGAPTFRQLLARVRQVALDAYEHQEGPFEKLLEELQPRRDLSHNPLFQVYCNLVHGTFEEFAAMPAGDLPAGEIVESAFSVARFDLNLYLLAGSDRLEVLLSYRRDLFDPPTVRHLLGCYRTLLESIAEDPDQPISTLPLISAAERRELERLGREYPHGRIGPTTDFPAFPSSAARGTLPARFAWQVERAPGQAAVRTLEDTWSYRRIDRAANRAARAIQGALGRRGDERVALLAGPGVKAVQGMLGALKAGHAYVPLDPAYPSARLRFLLKDAGAAAILTEAKHVELARSLTGDGAALMIVEELAGLPADPVVSPAGPDSLAYILYTSGSTGEPKGVMQSHRGVLGHARAYVNALRIGPQDRLTLLSSHTFDAAVMDVYGALLSGATLCPIPLRELAVGEILDWMEDQQITICHATPTVFRYLTGALAPGRKLARVRLVVLGGEEARGGDVRLFQQHFGDECLLVNGLGPTESTLALQAFMDHETAADRRRVPVGYGVDGTRVELIGAGGANGEVLGEIGLSSPHLALGYWRRAAKTARSFVPAEGGGRIYRTGDFGRLRADGAIEFMGRRDAQVKIRGFRVEPGEVAAMLESHPAVRSAAVVAVADDGGEHRLAGYVVPAVGVAPRAADLLAFLRRRLPEYMVPSAVVSLDALPVTPNGKLDRPALPAPQWDREPSGGYVAPRSEIEQQIAAVWCEILGVDRVGVRDNFFDLGGHSLRLLQVQAELLKRLGRELRAADLFQYPTVETLAARLMKEAAPDRSLQRAAAARIGARRRTDGDDTVAVVAMAGRFPEAPDLEIFWRNIRDGVESIRVFTDEELRAAGVQEARLSDPGYVKARAVLDDADLFDAWFFGYNPREAELIDPQQRLFLECAWVALERAGYDPARYDGLIGVWAGADRNEYLENLRSHPEIFAEAGDFQLRLASDQNYLATRVSYKLDLKGPSVNVQTACSTSLVAVHEACAALCEQRCDMALAGSVSLGVPSVRGYLHQPGGILSPDGHCRPFDARAAGTVSASGVGIVVLKRLADAQRDGDLICALIRGTATNNDGARKVGYTAPSVDGQAEVIALAHAVAGVDPETITYVEAHGTGTALGDPVEVAALQQVFGEATERRQFCGLGSLKGNLGHLNATAGVGGLIKTALALRHRELPPSLHYQQPNPEIDFENSAFYVNAALKPWPSTRAAPRRAGVSSFGIGGTNAHAVLEEAPPPSPAEAPSRPEQLLVLSAKTPAALTRAAENLAAYLEQHAEVSLADVAWTQQTGRAELEHRRTAVAASVAEACAALRGKRQASSIGQAVPGHHDVAFLFPGQGAQYVGMGHELYQRERVFRAAVDRCCDLLAGELDADLRAVLYPASGASEEASARLKRTSWAQPALFVTEIALAEQWRSWGIEPGALAGHSIGELVAATLSGVFRLEDALSLVALRGRLMERMPAGVMTAVPLSAADVETRLAGEAGLWLSAVNGPSLCVVSGTGERVAAWEAELEAAGVACRRQHTSHAFHSALMEDAVAPFVEAVRAVTLGEPRIPYVSNVTGKWITAEDVHDPGYWGRHIRQAVRFSDGLDQILTEERRVVLEVGPGLVLGTLARQHPRWAPQRLAVASLRRPAQDAPDVEFLLGALGRLWAGGVTVPWRKVHAGERRRRVELPTYPFERQRFWVERQQTSEGVLPRSLAKLPSIDDWFSVPLWRQRLPVGSATTQAGHWLVVGAGAPAGSAVRALRDAGAEVQTASPESVPGSGAQSFPERIVLAGQAGEHGGAPVALLGLARALEALADGVEREVVVVCSGLHAITDRETRDPGAAALDAIARVMAQELPGVRCRTVDVGDGVPDQKLAVELLAGDGPPTIALRGERRWSLGYQSVALAGTVAERVAADGKVYLVTGGLGHIGLALAESLARDARVTLVLSSRTPLRSSDDDDARVRRVRAIEALGATVMVVPADVSDPRQVARLIGEIDARLGRLDGVIHAAGVTGGGSLRAVATLDAEAWRLQSAPKQHALTALDEALSGRPLDFRVATSSISTVLGGLELGVYAAANAAMEAAAAASPDGWRTIALDGWTFAGDGAAAARSEALRLAMTPDEGVEATRRAIMAAAGLGHLIVSTADVEARLEHWVTARADDAQQSRPAVEGHTRPALSTAYAAPETDTQQAVVGFWQEVLGINRVGIDDDFLELGGHSLLATQAASRMRERFGIALPVRALFLYPTVAELAEEIERIRWASASSPAPEAASSDLVGGTL